MQDEPVTDMMGQEVQVGDRIACAFRAYYGTAPQLRVGTVIEITHRKSSERNGLPKGERRPVETHLRVTWDESSTNVESNLRMEELIARDAAKGKYHPHAIRNQKYTERTTEILVRLKRFIKIG